jgi:4-deoxy-L-threo-5-hexosulose-uronate ketol-isomerase
MIIKNAIGPIETKNMDTQGLRDHFLVENVMQDGIISMTYTHYDRLILGGAVPAGKPLLLETVDALKASFFLERRELGIILVSGEGSVVADGESYPMKVKDCLYIGRGVKNVSFMSAGNKPARFFFTSAPAHAVYPVMKMSFDEAVTQALGSMEKANERTIYKFIHPDGIQSCQLVMGFTELKTGSVWNTMPPHLHDRRMEAYFYFNLPEEDRVLHFMGEKDQTRHLVLANHQAVISPPWSIHSGAGTSSYSFVWAMAGENQSFADMDPVPLDILR